MRRRAGNKLRTVSGGQVAWLLGFAWLGLVFAGMAIAFTPSPHSPALGWGLLGIAALVLVFTMDRWVKVFPGLLAYGVVGSILMLMNGHAVNHPEVLVSKLEAALLIVFFATAAALSFTFTKHKLTVPDRIALIAFIFCFFWQAVAAPHASGTGYRVLLSSRCVGI